MKVSNNMNKYPYDKFFKEVLQNSEKLLLQLGYSNLSLQVENSERNMIEIQLNIYLFFLKIKFLLRLYLTPY